MIAADPFSQRPQLDEPWRRLAWLTPSALLLWALLLIGFALLLQTAGRPPEPVERLEARLIDLPPPGPPAGLQGAAETASQPAVAPAAAEPQPPIERKREEVPVPRVKKRKPLPPTVYDAHGPRTAPPVEAEGGGAAAQAPAAGGSGAAGGGTSGRAGAGGLGADSIGARAIYAPVPKIPDDLRENVFETVAVAHFKVTFDGAATTSLVQPTSNPRLNAIVLDTLKEWRFFPAIRNGIAIDSEFDIRIPITVQ